MIAIGASKPKLVSVDVFDTLLLRGPESERRRMTWISKLVAERLKPLGLERKPAHLLRARLEAQSIAYNALRVTGDRGDVKLGDILHLQALALGLPDSALDAMREAEIVADTRTLRPNLALIQQLEQLQSQGQRVVAVSDIYYTGAEVRRLLQAHGADRALGAVYASADYDATKKGGRLFAIVAQAEGVALNEILHLGDDHRADFQMPSSLGVAAQRTPRPLSVRLMRKIDSLSPKLPQRAAPTADADFGAATLGPILAEFALRLFLFARAFPANSQILFCARGGLRLRQFYEQFLDRIGQPSPLPCDDLMISRLAVSRGALLAGSPAALDEIGREFKDGTLASTLVALAQKSFDLSPAWRAPFERARFVELFNSDEPAVVEARRAIAEQAQLFDAHFAAKRTRDHVLLCDTGLYGSTLRLLMAAYPDLNLSCAMIARSNYKGFADEHFSRTAGLLVERNAYSVFDSRSALLRYWQLIEHVCEPTLESVKLFVREPDGAIRSNLERPGWRDAVAPQPGELYAGALSYLAELSPETYGARLAQDVPRAWREFKRRVLWPSAADRDLLAIGERGRDFGRAETTGVLTRERLASLAALRGSHWREGAAAYAPFGLRTALQAGLEGAHIARQFRREWLPRVRALAG